MRRLALLLLFAASVVGAQDEIQTASLAPFDAGGDDALSLSELVEYYISADPKLRELRDAGLTQRKLEEIAEDWAVDAISATCPSTPCPPLPLTQANRELIADVRKALPSASTAKSNRIGWKGLGFKRFVTDPSDPRKGWKTKRPVVFSYLRDDEANTEEEERRDQFSFLGSIQLWKKDWEANASNLFSFTPGIEMDINGSKEAFETSLTAALPVSWTWISKDGTGFLDNQILTVSPKYISDRAFDREAWEISADWTFSSIPLGRSGFFSFFNTGAKPPGRFTWAPTIGLTAGKIQDAAGNEKLEAIAELGSYTRASARVSAQLRPPGIERLILGADYFYRYDFDEEWTRGYLEASLAWDANAAKNVQLTLVYRKGRKPPAFEKIDQLLLGLSLLQ